MFKPLPYGYHRFPLALLGLLVLICVLTVYDPPAGRFSWLLEVGPGLAGVAALALALLSSVHDRSMAVVTDA